MLKQWFKNLVPFGTSVHTCWQHGCISAARSNSACCLVSRRSQSNERPPDSGMLLTAVSMSTPTPGGGYQGSVRACSSSPGFGDLCVFLRVQGQVVRESPKWQWLGHEDWRYERVAMAANPGLCGGQQRVPWGGARTLSLCWGMRRPQGLNGKGVQIPHRPRSDWRVLQEGAWPRQ